MRNAVVFDMDGVLLDSERLLLDCWKQALTEEEQQYHEDLFLAAIGRSEREMRESINRRYDGTGFDYQRTLGRMLAIYRQYMESGGVPTKPGAVEILRELKQIGCPLALASSNTRAYIDEQLETAGLLSYFDQIVSADDITNAKPYPEIYQKACALLGVAPEDAYALEDSFAGMRSAQSAGMMAIMVPDIIPPDDEIRRLSHKICACLDDARDYLMTAIV
ncbi:MAG: HAD family phosphatase [Clostridia bacterium]